MRILITGATGFIGSHIATAATEAGHQLVLCARDTNLVTRRFPDAEVIQVDFTRDFDTALWLQRVKDIDIVINTVGIIREHGSQTFDALHRDTPIALFRACEIAGVKRVIQISALGADVSAHSHYHLSKRAADRQLASLKLDWVMLMP
ncbi:MAG: SDR family NAD(P)-dependent oxidoreductase, partial [gamma proteobacterium symbiont of Ctena orbiculata]